MTGNRPLKSLLPFIMNTRPVPRDASGGGLMPNYCPFDTNSIRCRKVG